ncbi:phenylglyoxylate dehydrogenase [Bacillus sp. FJAT-45350]|uniref:phenylglyoxylate dehydrogenase n=1 Tax=Bacillus sp. FJAT-45350 TaxID=2011014 RepID=UPI000BB817A6|nr:phenylglyoxylate dehydrogenase [Bacillus sp. FJAT-45350]
MGKIDVLNGNKAAAWGASLAKVSLLAAYPITPQTPLVEYLAQFVAEEKIDADLVEVESEHTALSVLQGGVFAGARTFTGTSSQGLALMYEPYIRTSTMRLPIVMALVTREVISPQTVWGGQQDAVTVKEAGWIQIWCESNQEVLDTVVQAYKIAENKDVLLPVNVCYDGFSLSHMAERVEIPEQEQVDEFLPPPDITHVLLDPKNPMSVDPLTAGPMLTEFRHKQVTAMRKSKEVIEDVRQEWAELFGRDHGGLLDLYRMDDAEIAIVCMGSPAGTARVVIDEMREQGIKVGMLRIRVLRPFPSEEARGLLKDMKAIGVIDRNVSFASGYGTSYIELKNSFGGIEMPPMMDFIGGLGGSDVTIEHIKQTIIITQYVANGGSYKDVTWFGLEDGDIDIERIIVEDSQLNSKLKGVIG